MVLPNSPASADGISTGDWMDCGGLAAGLFSGAGMMHRVPYRATERGKQQVNIQLVRDERLLDGRCHAAWTSSQLSRCTTRSKFGLAIKKRMARGGFNHANYLT